MRIIASNMIIIFIIFYHLGNIITKVKSDEEETIFLDWVLKDIYVGNDFKGIGRKLSSSEKLEYIQQFENDVYLKDKEYWYVNENIFFYDQTKQNICFNYNHEKLSLITDNAKVLDIFPKSKILSDTEYIETSISKNTNILTLEINNNIKYNQLISFKTPYNVCISNPLGSASDIDIIL